LKVFFSVNRFRSTRLLYQALIAFSQMRNKRNKKFNKSIF